MTASQSGSSPLSRGILGVCGHDSITIRIIPALAGNTAHRSEEPRPDRDHPRSRGEYHDPSSGRPQLAGSSPLSRGIPRMSRILDTLPRIIPALAGNTPALGSRPPCRQDHPRSRGEYHHRSSCEDRWPGSSPLSRGIPTRRYQAPRQRGIIPALAGNTDRAVPALSRHRDHPRSRGEYLEQQGPIRHRERIIPALAGNTSISLGICRAAEDHPRSRGEYRALRLQTFGTRGSSPLSRGIRGLSGVASWLLGIIPALAGNTPVSGAVARPTGDHPRSRGEYRPRTQEEAWAAGSSPLSRGIRRWVLRLGAAFGIIPALAGNTSWADGTTLVGWDHPRSRGEYGSVSPGNLPGWGIIPALAGNTGLGRKAPNS